MFQAVFLGSGMEMHESVGISITYVVTCARTHRIVSDSRRSYVVEDEGRQGELYRWNEAAVAIDCRLTACTVAIETVLRQINTCAAVWRVKYSGTALRTGSCPYDRCKSGGP
jgi:hypothetical protein